MTKIPPAGEAPWLKNAVFEGDMDVPRQDPVLAGAKKRRCAACGKRFAPTRRRRMLCLGCYTNPPKA